MIRNWGYAFLVIILAFASCFITIQLTNMRVGSLERKVDLLEYDVQTHESVINEVIK